MGENENLFCSMASYYWGVDHIFLIVNSRCKFIFRYMLTCSQQNNQSHWSICLAVSGQNQDRPTRQKSEFFTSNQAVLAAATVIYLFRPIGKSES